MTDTIETWQEMKDRHVMERAEAACRLRDAGLTQADAARVLDMNPNTLCNFLANNEIPWPIPEKGFKITLQQYRRAMSFNPVFSVSKIAVAAYRKAMQ